MIPSLINLWLKCPNDNKCFQGRYKFPWHTYIIFCWLLHYSSRKSLHRHHTDAVPPCTLRTLNLFRRHPQCEPLASPPNRRKRRSEIIYLHTHLPPFLRSIRRLECFMSTSSSVWLDIYICTSIVFYRTEAARVRSSAAIAFGQAHPIGRNDHLIRAKYLWMKSSLRYIGSLAIIIYSTKSIPLPTNIIIARPQS